MDDLISWLVDNEPAISAIVGLVTLTTGSWGFIMLALYRRRLASGRQDKAFNVEGLATQREGVFRSLFDIGLSDHSQLEELISVRTVNITLFGVLLVSLIWIAMSLISRELLSLTLLHGTVFVFALLVYSFQFRGQHEIARWLTFALLTLYWGATWVLVGRGLSVEFWLPLLLIMPTLLFGKGQVVHVLIAIAFLVAVTVIAFLLQYEYQPLADAVIRMPEFVRFSYYLNVVLVSLTVFMIVNFYRNVASNKFFELEAQKRRTEELVNSMIPDYVARRLREQPAVIADFHDEATVAIVTLAGFDELSNRISATHLVEILGQAFMELDELVRRFGIEKINTLDTTYVVATGIDRSKPPDHIGVADFTLGAVAVVKRLSDAVGHRIALRAGLSTGHVVSGVIGDVRPSFDIWGGTVELANAMRDSAPDNTIVVNEPAYFRLRESFELGKLDGPAPRFLLLSRKLGDHLEQAP